MKFKVTDEVIILEALLDYEGRLIEGFINSGLTPALYENGEYIFSEWFAEQ